jgi:hypothetical protein
LKRLTAHAADLYASGAPVVLAGDYNVVPTDLDIYPTKSWDRDALLQPESRAAYQRFLSQGWTGAIRALDPRKPMYTFWDYMRKRWERDSGLRLDHVLLSSALTERLQDAGVDRPTRGVEGASDHVPVWVKLRDAPDRRGAPLRRPRGQAPRAATTASSKSGNSARRTGGRTTPQTRGASVNTPAHSHRPCLVIDGDSFAHRSYHALPKTIRRRDGKSAGAILGFANFLLRLYADERPRADIVGWDSLEAPTKRHEMFPAHQSGREFDEDLIEQLGLVPEFVAACGFVKAKASGFEADDFLAATVASEERAGGSPHPRERDQPGSIDTPGLSELLAPLRRSDTSGGKCFPASFRSGGSASPMRSPRPLSFSPPTTAVRHRRRAFRGRRLRPGLENGQPPESSRLEPEVTLQHSLTLARLFRTQRENLRRWCVMDLIGSLRFSLAIDAFKGIALRIRRIRSGKPRPATLSPPRRELPSA